MTRQPKRFPICDWKFSFTNHARHRFEQRVADRFPSESVEDWMSKTKACEAEIVESVRKSCPSHKVRPLNYLRRRQGSFVFVASVEIFRFPTRLDCKVRTFLVYRKVVAYEPIFDANA